jgi:hypothetical protein
MYCCHTAYAQNPYTLWVIAHHEVFKGVLSRTSLLCDKEVLPHAPAHSLEDALVFYEGAIKLKCASHHSRNEFVQSECTISSLPVVPSICLHFL